jgi:hypothetical protein
MYALPRSKHQTVELIVPASTTGNQVAFPDIPELRSDVDKDAVIFGIRTYSADSLPKAVSGNSIATFAQLQNAFVTLQVLGTDQIKEIPLIRLMDQYGTQAGYFFNLNYFELSPERVEWTKSYVSFAVPPANVAAYSYLFEFAYEWMPPGSYGKWLKNEWNRWGTGVIKTNG